MASGGGHHIETGWVVQCTSLVYWLGASTFKSQTRINLRRLKFSFAGQMIGRGEISMSECAAMDGVAICLFCNFFGEVEAVARVEQSLTVQVCVMAVAVPPTTLNQTVI